MINPSFHSAPHNCHLPNNSKHFSQPISSRSSSTPPTHSAHLTNLIKNQLQQSTFFTSPLTRPPETKSNPFNICAPFGRTILSLFRMTFTTTFRDTTRASPQSCRRRKFWCGVRGQNLCDCLSKGYGPHLA